MTRSDRSSGGDFLARKNDVMHGRSGIARITDVLVVEDETIDADRMRATLHIMLGYEVQIRRANTLNAAVDQVMARMPHLVMLDDYLKPSDDASQTIPFLRRAGFDGPIIVVSGRATRQRRLELIKAGASDVIHKDEVDSVRLSETLGKIMKARAASPAAGE